MSRTTELQAADVETIRAALAAAVAGPYFPDEEFWTLMGLTRAEVADILKTWPATTDAAKQDIAVNNVLLMLIGYPHGESEAFSRDIPVDPSELRALLARWNGMATSSSPEPIR